MQPLYPLKFKTIFKDKIWGGQKIKTYLHKDFGASAQLRRNLGDIGCKIRRFGGCQRAVSR
jgi:hypothetical protein